MRKSELLKIDEKNSKRTVTYIVKISNINFKLAFNMKKKIWKHFASHEKLRKKKRLFRESWKWLKGLMDLLIRKD